MISADSNLANGRVAEAVIVEVGGPVLRAKARDPFRLNEAVAVGAAGPRRRSD